MQRQTNGWYAQGGCEDAVAALFDHVCEQLRLLSISFMRCLLVVEGSDAFLKRTWSRAEVLYEMAENAGIALKLLTSDGSSKSEARHSTSACAVDQTAFDLLTLHYRFAIRHAGIIHLLCKLAFHV